MGQNSLIMPCFVQLVKKRVGPTSYWPDLWFDKQVINTTKLAAHE